MTVHGEYWSNRKGGGPRRRLEPWEVSRVCQLYKEGNSIETVASLCGVSRNLVQRILKEEGVPTRKKGRGELHTLDTWIDRQLEVEGPTILERREAGATFVDLARIYKVSVVQIRRHVVKLREMRERRYAA